MMNISLKKPEIAHKTAKNVKIGHKKAQKSQKAE